MSKKITIDQIKELYLTESIKLSRDEEIIDLYNKIIKLAAEANLRAYKLCFEGHKALKQNDYVKARKKLDEAIKLDKKIPYSWYYLGIIYSHEKQFTNAISCYEKAIKLDTNFAFPLIGLGNVYRSKEEYHKAIEYFDKAKKLDSNLSFYSYYNLGIVYLELRRYDKALENFEQAEKIDSDNTFALYYIGLIYKELEDYGKAISYFDKAKKIDNENGEQYEVQRDSELIEITRKIEENLESVEQLVNTDSDNKIGQILKNTQQIFKSSENKKNDFLDFLRDRIRTENSTEFYLEILRRWNSYTPIVADDYHISKGGGYFINAGGSGIVIDPGFNFIENFKGAGHTFAEINAVVISHAHNDHTADLESILTLLYKYNDEIKNSKDPAVNSIYNELLEEQVISKKQNKITGKEIEDRFDKSGRRKIIDIFMPQSVFKKYGGLFDLFKRSDYHLHIIEKGRTDIELQPGCKLKMDVLGANHFDIISDCSSIGIVLHTDKSAIVYTGDTGWNTEIEKEYCKVAEKTKNKKSVLIAHLGGFKEYEYEYATYVLANNTSAIEKSYYKNHLGRIGVAKVAEIIKPELCLISEFGEEFKEHRQEIAEIYNNAFNNERNVDDAQSVKFLPADIGLVYYLEDNTNDKKNKVKAITEIAIESNEISSERGKQDFIDKNRSSSRIIKYGFVDTDKIKTILLRENYSLHYYGNGLVEPEEISQLLKRKYQDSIR